MLKRAAAIGLLLSNLTLAAELEPKRPSRKFWWASLAALSVASVLDVHSSWGKPEMNPLLRNGDGRFGSRGVQLKLGMVGASSALQWCLLRKRPEMQTTFAGLNAGMAAWTTGVAARNYR